MAIGKTSISEMKIVKMSERFSLGSKSRHSSPTTSTAPNRLTDKHILMVHISYSKEELHREVMIARNAKRNPSSSLQKVIVNVEF